MQIQRLNIDDKGLVKQCDKLMLKFLDGEAIYDENFLKRDKLNSFINDIDNENNILLVANQNETVLGFLYGYIEKANNNIQEVAHLGYIYVEKEYRNNKLATMLIDEFISQIKNKGIEFIEVKCFKNNEIANSLYTKYGFNVLWSNYRKRI